MKTLTLALFTATLLLADGKELYTTKCASCHGPNGEGKAAIAKMFNVTMPALSSKEVQAKSDADLKKVITAGKGKMKPITSVTDAQAGEIVAFIRTLK